VTVRTLLDFITAARFGDIKSSKAKKDSLFGEG
jgi:hypothetical protein